MADQTTTIPKGWHETTLGAIKDKLFSGGTPNTQIDEYWNGDLNWLSSGETGQRFIYDTKKKITQKGATESSTRFADKNLIVIATAGQGNTRGQTSLLKTQAYINQSVIAIDCNKKIADNIWFFYNLSNRYSELRFISESNSIRGSLTTNILSTLKVLLPSLPEQRAIAAVLSSLDDKIELLREQNKTLEATAQAIFKEWFVNFNFPGATGKMIGSELGDLPAEASAQAGIPEEWRVGTVNDFIKRETISYRCDQDDLSVKGKTPIIDQGTNGLYGYTEREPDFHASKDNPVILFTNHTCNMWFVNYPFCAIQNVIPFRGNTEYSTFFVFYMTLGKVKFIEYKGHWPDFEQKKHIIPKPEIANQFAEFVKPLQYKIWNNNYQVETLSKLRDTLLPKLMKGDVRVKGFKD